MASGNHLINPPIGFSPSPAYSAPTMSCSPDAHRNNALPKAEDPRFTSPGQDREGSMRRAGEIGTKSRGQAEPRYLLPQQRDALALCLR